MTKGKKLNCWEFKRCGREVDGFRVAELGICPACMEARTDGMNNGVNGGRVCWAVSGTFCGGNIQGTFAQKVATCVDCDFYQYVQEDEGELFCNLRCVLERLRSPAPVPENPLILSRANTPNCLQQISKTAVIDARSPWWSCAPPALACSEWAVSGAWFGKSPYLFIPIH